MRSTLPKVLHPLAGLPLLAHVLNAVEAIPSTESFAPLADKVQTSAPLVVLGSEAEQIEAALDHECKYVLQEEPLGTGHALLMAREAVNALQPLPQTVLVCHGDMPLMTSDTLACLLAAHLENRASVTFVTVTTENPSDFGRVIRDASGRVRGIVEVKQATEEQKRIQEINPAIYCFDREWLWPNLERMPRSAAGEYYLTDLIALACEQGRQVATVDGSMEETLGVNNRVQLAAAEQVVRRRILEDHMYAGVTIVDPATTYIDAGVEIEADCVILPGCSISGKTRIGGFSRIGPGSVLEDSILGKGCVVRQSVLEATTLEDGVSVGPFSHCRAGAYLAQNVRMGNFAEVKNSYVGSETDMHHFSYLGDATVGTHVNIGAGTITCNFDGVRKNRTVIGDRAFIGSDTMLVAPVEIGEQAQTGAGSVVRHDVPPGAVVVGVPARLLRQPHPTTLEDGKKE